MHDNILKRLFLLQDAVVCYSGFGHWDGWMIQWGFLMLNKYAAA